MPTETKTEKTKQDRPVIFVGRCEDCDELHIGIQSGCGYGLDAQGGKFPTLMLTAEEAEDFAQRLHGGAVELMNKRNERSLDPSSVQ